MKNLISKYISGYSLGGWLLCGMLSLALWGCSDDLDIRDALPDYGYGEDYITIDFEMPDTEHVITRSYDDLNERKITDFTVLIFDKSDYLLKRDDFTSYQIAQLLIGLEGENRKFTYQLAVNEEDISNQNIGKITAVANTILSDGPDLLSGFNGRSKTFEDFLDIMSSMNRSDNGFIMSGIKNETGTLRLTRTAAKISLKNEYEDANFSLHNFAVYNMAKDCYLPAAVRQNQNRDWYSNTITSSTQQPGNVQNLGVSGSNGNVTFDLTDYCYVNPTKTHEELKVYTYVVMYAAYHGKNYYYAVPLYYSNEREDGTKDEGYYDIEPNHWYDMRIKKVLKEGDPDPETAIKNHNNNQIWVEIHDHNPEVLTMISDGIHELGATREIRLDKVNNKGIITIKCFAADMDNIDLNEIEFVKDSWIDINLKNQSAYTKEEDKGTALNPDKNNPGMELKYEVTINTSRQIFSEETNIIKVRWKGLEREITVVYDPGFSMDQICKASLTIQPGSGEGDAKKISNYWTFVEGLGEAKTESSSSESETGTPKLFGIKAEDMVNSKKRTGGFHFPMPYGKNFDTTPWEYIYTLDFSKQNNTDVSGIIEKIEAIPSGDTAGSITWTPSTRTKGTLTWTGSKTSYNYVDGSIKFIITYNNESVPTELVMNVYHTGFFHYDSDPKYCPDVDKGYYYYEVVPMGSGYWLDRNIGAKGSLRFIDTEDSTNPIGDKKNGGRLFTIATPRDYEGAIIDTGMCPPGYHIPNQGEWDDIRMTTNFTAQAITSADNSMFVSTFYRTGNAKIGNVYFQKARFYNESNVYIHPEKYTEDANVGDAGGGYYWTTTQAPAMEKQYMGNWFRALYLIGSSASYNNASVYDHRMLVRCKAGASVAESQEHFVSLNAHNVTHVFLFDKVSKTPLYNFPGKALGSASSSKSWQYFYCSTTLPLDQLLVIFTKVDENGKVTLYTKDGDGYSTSVKYSKDILNEKYAWTVERGKYYDFCTKASTRPDGIVTEEQPDECDAVTSGSGSGGDDGGGVANKGRYETERVEGTNLKPDDNEVILWQGDDVVGWDENHRINCSFWDLVQPGTKIRIYGQRVDSSAKVGIRYQGWGNFLGTADDVFQYNNVNGYVEIELREDLLKEIRQHGIMVVGDKFRLTYFTIVDFELPSGPYVWEGNIKGTWSDDNPTFSGLLSTNYNWDNVTANSKLRISYIGDAPQIKLLYGDNSFWMQIDPWNYSGWQSPVTITLSANDISTIKSKGGIKFCGGNYDLTKVEIIIN